MALRSAQVFKKSVVSRVEAGGSPAAPSPTAPVANGAPFLRRRMASIFWGRRISTRWPVLLRSSRRKAPSSSRRRTAWRTGPLERPSLAATDITENCRRSLPTTREWRSRWEYTARSKTVRPRRGARTSSNCIQRSPGFSFLGFMCRSLKRESRCGKEKQKRQKPTVQPQRSVDTRKRSKTQHREREDQSAEDTEK